MIEIIAAALVALAAGYVMGRKDARAALSADARRWRIINYLRNKGQDNRRVTIFKDDGAGRASVGVDIQIYRGASVDDALDRAINDDQ